MAYKKYPSLPEQVWVGYRAEQHSRNPRIEISEVLADLPNGTPQLLCMRPGETTAYLATITMDGSTLVWNINGYDTEKRGVGAIQVLLTESGSDIPILMSQPIPTYIDVSIYAEDAEVPDPWESWLSQILAAASRAESAAARAESADDAVEDAKDQAISAIETKGAETLDSIPSDYTALSGDVSDLKSALSDMDGLLFYGEDVTPGTAIFTSDDVNAGDTVYYDFSALAGKAGYISIEDANGVRITYFGKGSSSITQNDYTGSYVIPENFAVAKTAGNGNLSKCKFTKYEFYADAITTVEDLDADRNLFDPSKVTEGFRGVVSDTPQHLEAQSGWFITDYLSVEPNDTIEINWWSSAPYYGHIWYDQELNPIGGTVVNQANMSMVVPQGASFVRLSGQTTAFSNGFIKYRKRVTGNSWKLSSIDSINLQSFVNLFDSAKAIDGYAFSRYGSGEIVAANNFITDFIPVMPKSTVFINQQTSNNYGHAWFDRNKNYLSVSVGTSNNFTVPDNAYFMVATGTIATKSTLIIRNTPIIKTIIEREQPNEYARYTLHSHGELEEGFNYAAFPGACFFNGNLVAGYRIAPQHTTTDTYGGVVLHTRTPDGIWSKVAYITNAGTTIKGELRDPHLNVTKDGKTLLLSGFTTYTENGTEKHDNYIIKLNANFEIVNYYCETAASAWLWGGILETPTGYFLYMSYSSAGCWVNRSTAPFSGDASELSFTQVMSAAVQGQQLSEATLGYFGNRLYMLARNDNLQTMSGYIASTTNLEGTDGWSERTQIGINLHAPVLLPVCGGKYLVFAGAYLDHYTSDADRLRYPTIGLINPDTGTVICHAIVDKDVIGYSGYCGLVYYGGDEFGIVYYEDKGFTAVYYKRVNLRAYCPEMQYMAL